MLGAVCSAQSPEFVNQYCVTCHNQRLKTAGLMLDTLDPAKIPSNAETWEKVIVKLSTGAMPPAGMPHPDAAATHKFVSSIEVQLDSAAQARPYAGRPLLHRMNRAEYAGAIRDLLALDVDSAALLPPYDSAYGFDNVADVLGLSPSLQERYLSAAESISALAVGDPHVKPAGATSGSVRIFRRTSTSRGCRSERRAESWCTTISRWMANTSSRPSSIART